MTKKLTNEEFKKRVWERNERYRSGDVDILGDYNGMRESIKCRCNIHNIIWEPIAFNLCNGSGCDGCVIEKIQMARRTPNDEFIEKLKAMNSGISSLDSYINNSTTIRFQCLLGHVWSAKPYSVLNGSGCPYCSNRKVLVGYNDLWTTHPYISKLLKNPDDGHKYTYGSNKKLDFVCSYCGTISNKSIKAVCCFGFFCNYCSDHISWPNKFTRAILKQCKVDDLEYEWSPEWLTPYSYDNKFISSDGVVIVCELDGGVGHGNKVFGSNEQDIEGLKRDMIKDALAAEHNVHVIRVDCCYEYGNRFEYIKQHILESELADIIDLSNVDWIACDAEALSSLVVQSAGLYNDGYAIFEIADLLGYCRATITNWIKQAANVGLCQYDKNETRRRSHKAYSKAVHQYTINGMFVSTYHSLADASRKTNILYNDIWCCCKHIKYHKSAGGYLWFYADDPDQPDKSKIILNNTKLM